MDKFKHLLFGVAIFIPIAAFAAGNNSHDMDKMLLDMEAHWKQVIAENNLSKRQRMLKDHANMMMEIEGIKKGLSPEQRKATHHHSHNVLEMHRMMMNTMIK